MPRKKNKTPKRYADKSLFSSVASKIAEETAEGGADLHDFFVVEDYDSEGKQSSRFLNAEKII